MPIDAGVKGDIFKYCTIVMTDPGNFFCRIRGLPSESFNNTALNGDNSARAPIGKTNSRRIFSSVCRYITAIDIHYGVAVGPNTWSRISTCSLNNSAVDSNGTHEHKFRRTPSAFSATSNTGSSISTICLYDATVDGHRSTICILISSDAGVSVRSTYGLQNPGSFLLPINNKILPFINSDTTINDEAGTIR